MIPSIFMFLITIMIPSMVKYRITIQKFRKLHTIISQETIKPSSPTPSHLKTHNLSLIDYLSPNIHMPIIYFFQNHNNGVNINKLKNSLSQSLTRYYPFAGRLVDPFAPQVDCNDDGVEFLEASVDSRLDDFIFEKDQGQTFNQLIPNGLGCAANKTGPNMVAVQLNRFACGGAAMAVSISHKVGDALTMAQFVNHWATLNRGDRPLRNPSFVSSSMNNFKMPEFPLVERERPKVINYATRRFIFPNSKLSELKNKINQMGASPLNPTRVESLSSLLFQSAVGATTAKSGGSAKPSSLNLMVNLRGTRTRANFPKLAPGNLYSVVMAKIEDSSRIELNEVITGVRKEIMALGHGVRGMEDVGKMMVDAWLTLMDDRIRTYTFSSLCWFPFYEVDFGWGKPVHVMLGSDSADANVVILMDTPSGDGIEATVQLEEEEMVIFRKDEKLLAYAQEQEM